ncbi:hypothetical protein J6590_044649 [Homalodisca vitripennis]|nr:hypothetical protein J6590_044649 [Homalodisca vitripennis]
MVGLISFTVISSSSCPGAALAPLPLTMVQAQNPVPASDLDMASQILTVAVLSILITSPLGAIGTTIGGPRLLKQSGMAST